MGTSAYLRTSVRTTCGSDGDGSADLDGDGNDVDEDGRYPSSRWSGAVEEGEVEVRLAHPRTLVPLDSAPCALDGRYELDEDAEDEDVGGEGEAGDGSEYLEEEEVVMVEPHRMSPGTRSDDLDEVVVPQHRRAVVVRLHCSGVGDP